MKIIVITQPFPMGEYHWKRFEADYLTSLGHEVYMLEQLNGRDYNQEYIDQIKELDPDLIYSTPADHKTFEVLEQINCKKVINICSKGIMKDHINEWTEYRGRWWDSLFTNSIVLANEAKKYTKDVIHYEYPLIPIEKDSIEEVPHYKHDCVFLGQGFHRLEIPEFKMERETFFLQNHDFDFKVYGNGWPRVNWYAGGVLPDGDIGRLYASAKSAIGVIEQDQRIYGLINNRYSEMAYCKIPIISFDYPEVDWYGAEKYINFITSAEEVKNVVNKCKNNNEQIIKQVNDFKQFIDVQHKTYLEKLEHVIKL